MAEQMPAASEPRADPGDPHSAIERYRDLAKYLITVVAAVGGLLVAGTQLASIGKLSWRDEPARVLATVIGLGVAIAAVALVIRLVLRVLRPIELSLSTITADPDLVTYLQARPSLLGGLATVQDLLDQLSSPVLDDDELATWTRVADRAVDAAAYHQMQTSFDRTWRPLLVASFIGAAGIVAFTWGANPPPSAAVDSVVPRSPALVSIALTADGRATLSSALGEACARDSFRALVIGGTDTSPRVVTIPERGCQAVQFVLQPQWGAPIAVK